VNFGLLAAEIISLLWGTPANFTEFCVLAPLPHVTLVLGVSETWRNLAALSRGGHLYLAGRPSRWALVHILVYISFFVIFGRPFVKQFALCYQTVVCLFCLSSLSVCPVGLQRWCTVAKRLNGSRWNLACVPVGLGPVHIVLDGDPAHLPQRGESPIFGPYLLWPNNWMDQDATW